MLRRRICSAEFKREAVALVNQPGVPKSQIAREFGIKFKMITRWLREKSTNSSKVLLSHGVARDEELASLEHEVYRLRRSGSFC